LTKRTWLLAALLTTAMTSLGHTTERQPLDLECEIDPVCVEDAIARAIIINADFDRMADADIFPIDPRLDLITPVAVAPQLEEQRQNPRHDRTPFSPARSRQPPRRHPSSTKPPSPRAMGA
jgi:hypothetical protein